jgi:dolichyl-phosphate beta-glucosyltransferase
MHVRRWIFDVELLLMANFVSIPIAEISVNWQEIDGSKLSVATDSIQMALDLAVIRANYFWGIWRKPVVFDVAQ